MWIVNGALKRPITVIITVIAIALMSVLSLSRMSVDIFPNLNLPVIYVVQSYGGMDPAQMESYLVSYYEYHFLYITGVEHIESQSIQSASIMKLYFHPDTNMSDAMSQVVAMVERSKAFMPPGTVSPFILRFDAGSVPVGYLVFSSDSQPVSAIEDLALFRVRPLFATLPGVSAPPPFGGNQRSIVIMVDPDRLRAFRLTPQDVVQSVASGNLVIPAGNAYTGNLERIASVNAVVKDVQDLQSLPLKLGHGPTVFLRDVARIKDSMDILTGYALVNGRRTVYIPVTKRADASTLAVVDTVKANLDHMRAVIPSDIKLDFKFDQSVYVREALKGVVFEGLMGAILTGLMILIFLRDLRSSGIVVLNIPFALLSAVVCLWMAGQSINIMTLGGLALAVGILVDEGTVAIENIHTHLARGEFINKAVFNATSEIAVPQLLAMLSVISVFMPAFFMQGATKSLFVPLSLAVAFAMASSYVLSRTFVPVLAVWVLKGRHFGGGEATLLQRLQERYAEILRKLLDKRKVIVPVYFCVVSLILILIFPQLGNSIFPAGGSDVLQLRLKAPSGTKYEETEKLTLKALKEITRVAGPENIDVTLAYAGTQPPTYAISNVYMFTSGPHEAVMLVAFKNGSNVHVRQLQEKLRKSLPQVLPGVGFSFEAGDIVNKTMNFGAPTPIEVDVQGPDFGEDRAQANRILEAMLKVPTLRDVQIAQPLNYPTVGIDVDRERAGQLGVTVGDVGMSAIPATYSSRFITPLYWADEKSGNSYQVQVEYPLYRMQSIKNVEDVPIMHDGQIGPYIRDVAKVHFGTMIGEYDRYNMQRMVSITANVYGTDLGRAAKSVAQAVKEAGKPPRGVFVNVRGQIPVLHSTFSGLERGLLLAVLAIILLLVGYFQSPRLGLIIVLVVPSVLAGAVTFLFITGTSLNIQSFMGAIMAIGVGVANAILVITFSEHHRMAGESAEQAALSGAETRLRPVLMTTCAMVAGMIPMSLGLSAGGAREAPLARAVIGGLLASTTTVLLILPLIFAMIQARAPRRIASIHPDDVTEDTIDKGT